MSGAPPQRPTPTTHDKKTLDKNLFASKMTQNDKKFTEYRKILEVKFQTHLYASFVFRSRGLVRAPAREARWSSDRRPFPGGLTQTPTK